MASYDRRILIPYLQDVCCAELLCRKLENEIATCRAEGDKYTQWANGKYSDPPEPVRKGGDESAIGGLVVSSIICIIGLRLMFFPILGIPVLGYGLIGVFTCLGQNSETKEMHNRQYEEELARYNKQVAQNKEYRARIPDWRMAAQKWRDQEQKAKANLRDAKHLREKLYSVNIIPSRYRTIQVAYYLYDFFSTGRATDLEQTLQTMLLDEIIQRMDKLIVQNEEILLNQRYQIAQQERQNRIDSDRYREQMEKIARMEQNQERQIDYERMISANQEVTNFFLAADYWRKNK